MKTTSHLSFAALAAASALSVAFSGAAFAQEQGRVISTTPVISQVAVPRQVCANEQITSTSQNNKSGGGALIGGVAGGAVGNALGKGSGRAAATAIGIFGGAILGNHLEGSKPETSTQNVQRCTTQTFYENKPTAYNVVYEFNGKQYQVQLPQDPGPFVSLQVTPVSAPAAPAVQPTPIYVPNPIIVRPITQAPVFTQPVIVESYTTYVQQPQVVYVRPAPVIYHAAPAYTYARPHAHSHLHPHLQPQHLAYPQVRYAPHHGLGHGQGYRQHGSVVSIGLNGHFR